MTQSALVKIPVWPLDMINAYFVPLDNGAVLIDTGLPGSDASIERSLASKGLGWKDIKLIVISHGHVDHVGSAALARRKSGAPILVHEDDIPYAAGEKPRVCVKNTFGHLFKALGAINTPFEAFEPDIVLKGAEPMSLEAFGLDANVLPTPGHTPGSLSVILKDGSAAAGDLISSGILLGGMAFRKRPKQLHFEEDTAAVRSSLERLLSLGVTSFHVGHGAPLPAAAVRTFLDHGR